MTRSPALDQVTYPDSDGQPLSDHTKQFNWIVTVKLGCEALFKYDPNVFVAGDLLWYPVEGSNTMKAAPDTMVIFGRPKGDRGSYQQWQEDHIPPQVAFEILALLNASMIFPHPQPFSLGRRELEFLSPRPLGEG
ncbi:MAG: hypothetical protein KME42_24565 [Tildeniella nuda ZEHNDER 1965/U140]|jgi:Uma2 family endonuclease|nr:hypothetical protein [Tildeniella nuda ZEHNDER 1965/U140]